MFALARCFALCFCMWWSIVLLVAFVEAVFVLLFVRPVEWLRFETSGLSHVKLMAYLFAFGMLLDSGVVEGAEKQLLLFAIMSIVGAALLVSGVFRKGKVTVKR